MRTWLIWGLMAAAPTSTPAPDFVTFRHEVTVERPVDEVWRKVGKYCDIAQWLKVQCELVSGSGDVGTVRRLNGATLEPMVGRTAHSYTYTQTAGVMAGLQYHGTLAAQAQGPRRTLLSYTITYDQALMPSDGVRASEHARLEQRFLGPLQVMKSMAEAR
jgi:hypothetical protein